MPETAALHAWRKGRAFGLPENLQLFRRFAMIDARALAEAIATLIAHGHQLPFQAVVLGLNGTLLAGSYTLDADGELVFTPSVSHGDGLAGPINMMVVDANGDASNIVFVLATAEREN